ncbi:hypothetical protein GQ457_11G025290 [Hibiscus cannabinus]
MLCQTLVAPYLRWFREEEHCKFHAGTKGHSIERCISFKRRVQHLLDLGVVEFEATTMKINRLVKSNTVKLDVDRVTTEKKMDENESTPMAIDMDRYIGHILVVDFTSPMPTF